ncbi:AtpZ/AtpI family protein [Thiomicrorhabdus aquaedulcis]|uniref:AtpZ/AtpI family protein n=1 Tax=Thiomicrorhabdus aquaedulcis TaxID=2211106 RepID=UPI001E2F6186|nr:AtpZ/AtpI family protein [Thiomicrorhabdus aquaedulcis]
MSDIKKESTPQASTEAPKPGLNILLMSAGSIFTSMIIAGFIVGYLLDELFGTMPIFLMLCGVLGFVGGMQKSINFQVD